MSFYLQQTVNPDKDKVLGQISGGLRHNLFLCIREKDARKTNTTFLDFDDDEKLVPVLSTKGFRRNYIAGSSECGKSYLVVDMLNTNNFPTYLFTSLDEILDSEDEGDAEDDEIDEDPYLYAKNEVEKIRCEDLPDDPLPMRQLAQHNVVFDDCDSFSDPRIKKYLDQFSDIVLKKGRHKGIKGMIVTNHILLDAKRSQNSFIQSNGIAAFLGCGLDRQIRDYLKNYAMLKDDQIERVMKFRGPHPYFMHYNKTPNCFIGRHEAIVF